MGNLGSIKNMLEKIGAPSVITSDPVQILGASKLILPGVGSFDNGMTNLHRLDFVRLLTEAVVEKKKPVLGICLGMQLFTKSSEEGRLPGLGWVDADTIRFRQDKLSSELKVPHMGWDTISIKRPSPIFQSVADEPRYYFVHSYHLDCHDSADICATTLYGYEFTSVVQRGNIIGTQFHPEKSHKFGLNLLKNFAEMA